MAQDDEFSKLPQASFDGQVFPVRALRIQVGSSAAYHRFPHRPGQRIEFTGRDPLIGTIVVPMFATMPFEANGRTVFWPDGAALLLERAQLQKTGPLVIPVYGTIEQAQIRIDAEYDAAQRDGANLTIQFTEDNGDVVAKPTVRSATSKLPELASGLANELAALAIRMENFEVVPGKGKVDLVTGINSLIALKDQADQSISNRITAATRVVGALEDLFKTGKSMFSDPANWQCREALLDLRQGVVDATHEGSAAARAVKTYTTAARTTAMDIATATSNTVAEIIALNSLPDFADIEEGEIIAVYAK